MRKYLIGFSIGVGLVISFDAYAAVESLIGKNIQNEYVVKLDGKELSSKAIAVDGSSYAPVRVIAETLGLKVDFINNEVILQSTKPEVESVESTVRPATQKPESLNSIINKIKNARINIEATKIGLGNKNLNKDDPFYQELVDRLAKYEAELAELEKQKAELEAK